MTPGDIALIAAAFAAGSFIFGASGFGFGLVTVPLLGIVLPLKQAIALQLPYAFLVAVAMAWHFRAHLDWRGMRTLLIPAVLALPLGVAALQFVPERPMKYFLAAFIIAAVSLPLAGILKSGVACGAASGFFQGTFTTGGPPAMLHLLSRHADSRAVKGTHGLNFIFLYAATTVLYALAGVVTAGDVMKATWFAPAVVLGGLAGHWAGSRLNFRQYRFLVNGLLVGAALLLAVRA